tara:strand:- start:18 stop:578 length:561 start_codon:yes stop_codon:yes gene_type:complete
LHLSAKFPAMAAPQGKTGVAKIVQVCITAAVTNLQLATPKQSCSAPRLAAVNAQLGRISDLTSSNEKQAGLEHRSLIERVRLIQTGREDAVLVIVGTERSIWVNRFVGGSIAIEPFQSARPHLISLWNHTWPEETCTLRGSVFGPGYYGRAAAEREALRLHGFNNTSWSGLKVGTGGKHHLKVGVC